MAMPKAARWVRPPWAGVQHPPGQHIPDARPCWQKASLGVFVLSRCPPPHTFRPLFGRAWACWMSTMPHLARISLWSLLAAGEGERGGLAGDENGSMWPRAPEKARFSDGGGEAWHRAPEHTWTGSGCQVCAQRPPAFPRARCHKAAGWGQGVLNSCSTSAASSKSNRTLPSVVGGVVGGGSGGGTGQVASGPLRRALRRPYKGRVDGRCRGFFSHQ